MQIYRLTILFVIVHCKTLSELCGNKDNKYYEQDNFNTNRFIFN